MAIAAGLTTMVGGGTGRRMALARRPARRARINLRAMLQSVDGLPLNIWFYGEGEYGDAGGVAGADCGPERWG